MRGFGDFGEMILNLIWEINIISGKKSEIMGNLIFQILRGIKRYLEVKIKAE